MQSNFMSCLWLLESERIQAAVCAGSIIQYLAFDGSAHTICAARFWNTQCCLGRSASRHLPVKVSAEYYVAADGQEEVASQSHKKKRSGGAHARGQVMVDKERLMTSTEAAATNEKLPKGFMYVPAHRLNSGAISGNE